MRRREFITGAAALAACMQLPTLSGMLAPAYGEALSGGGNPLPTGFYNFTGSNLANWQRASAAQQRGDANAVIGCLGDSTVAGQGAAAANVPFIDIWGLFGGTWNSFAMNDSLHPNQTGYALIAGYARTAILDPSARSVS
jgi:hypothetical protein